MRVEPAGTSLPTGTVTLLMTDVEGSTRGWVRSPDALTFAIPRHYEILDEAIATHGGARPVEQGEGDSVVAALGARPTPSRRSPGAADARRRTVAR